MSCGLSAIELRILFRLLKMGRIGDRYINRAQFMHAAVKKGDKKACDQYQEGIDSLYKSGYVRYYGGSKNLVSLHSEKRMNAVNRLKEHADDFPFACDINLINIRYPGRLEKK
jgi:hypothetical protein